MILPLLRIVFISLLAAQSTPNTVLAQVKAVPPLSGVIGEVQSVTDGFIDVQTGSGVVHVDIARPLTTYKQIPSDLSHVTSTSYVGVASTEQADGKEVAKQIIIFPEELRGAAEGSVLTDPQGATTHSRMTNGSVSRPAVALTHDERHGAERQRHHLSGPISGRLQDGHRARKRRRHASRARKSDTGSRRHHLFNDGQAAERNAYHEQDPCNRSSRISQHEAVGFRPMSHSTLPATEPNSTSASVEKPDVLVATKHHLLVRWSHWLNLPILLGLIVSGTSIYWASPVYQHKPDPNTGNVDVAADIGIWICSHVPGLHHYSSPHDWLYNHMSLGPGMLALALRLHWLCAYSFVLNGMVYLAGLVMGGGWRPLLPRRTDLFDALRMFRYYLGVPFAKLMRRKWRHPRFNTKYNALRRVAYFSIPVAGCLSVATGWAIHKPMQFRWLAALFGGFDAARVWHF
jgi:thiosulfate reductase cytochrome b subunit